jgi:hypothetical protein
MNPIKATGILKELLEIVVGNRVLKEQKPVENLSGSSSVHALMIFMHRPSPLFLGSFGNTKLPEGRDLRFSERYCL